MKEEKLGQEPAFPFESKEYGNVGINEIGMSKRFYAACSYADSAYKWAAEMSIDTCLKVLELPPETKWEYVIHFPKLVIGLQYILADKLLKQENQ